MQGYARLWSAPCLPQRGDLARRDAALGSLTSKHGRLAARIRCSCQPLADLRVEERVVETIDADVDHRHEVGLVRALQVLGPRAAP